MVLDFQLYGGSMTNTTYTSMAAIGDSSLQIKDLPNPRIAAIGMHGANLQAVRIYSPGLPTMGLAGQLGLNPNIMFPQALRIIANSTVDPQGYQDSGGAETDYAGILFGYYGKSPLRPGRPCGQDLTITTGSAAWGTAVSLVSQDASKKYQIIGVQSGGIASTAPIAIRFTHPDFKGCNPGLFGNATDVDQNNMSFFPPDDLPTFSGSTALQVACFGDGNADHITVLLNEF